VSTATIDPAYTATATVTGGRNGHGVTSDGVLDVDLTWPGTGANSLATNPEQLFALGYAACYQSALHSAAQLAGLDASTSEVQADVSLGKAAGSEFYGLAVVLTVRIPGMDLAKVQELADAAHERCPYSRATRGNIDVQIIAST
jgi:osmotically inducible protein OsmC